MLIVLHTLIYALRSEGVTLCMDEPENFLALAEIQPWLVTLYDFCTDGELQALLASHHPQLIDYLAVSSGYWFERQNGGTACAEFCTEKQTDDPPPSLCRAKKELRRIK